MPSEESTAEASPQLPRENAKPTPLPLRQLVALTFVIVNESICSTMLMPFVGYLVAYLQGISKDEAGKYSGTLVGVFMLGQVLSAHMWGKLSDVYGRRFPLISGLFTSGLLMLGFGLSTNIYICVLFRFLHGLFNGNVLVAKTMMADITDKSNAPAGFAFMSLCNGLGFLIGPILGGLLYNPAGKEELSWIGFDPNGIFAKRPALLPSIVIFGYSTVGMIICTIFIQESNPKARPLPWIVTFIYPCLWYPSQPFVHPAAVATEVVESLSGGSELGTGGSLDERMPPKYSIFSPVDQEDTRQFDHLVRDEKLINLCHPGEQPEAEVDVTVLVQTSDSHSDNGVPVNGQKSLLSVNETSNNSTDVALFQADSPTESEGTVIHRFGYREAFTLPHTRFMLLQYMVLSGADVVGRECFLLWAVATKGVGGMDLSTSQLSYILMCNSIPCLLANVFFRIVVERYNDKMGLFRMGVISAGTSVLLLPMTTSVTHGIALYLLVFLATSTRQIACSWCYSLNTMLTARAAPLGQVGSLMGINQSCGSLVRGIVPLFATKLFAWSLLPNHFFPFDHELVFLLAAMAFYFCGWRSYRIRTDTNGDLEMVTT